MTQPITHGSDMPPAATTRAEAAIAARGKYREAKPHGCAAAGA